MDGKKKSDPIHYSCQLQNIVLACGLFQILTLMNNEFGNLDCLRLNAGVTENRKP